MTFIRKDRVAETTTTTGTGPLALAGAIAGFRAFDDVMAVGDTCYYAIEEVNASGVPTGAWETGLATKSAADTLARSVVHDSSNAGAAVAFAAGTKRVMMASTATGLNEIEAISGSNTKSLFDMGWSVTNAWVNSTAAQASKGVVVEPIVNLTVDEVVVWFAAMVVGASYSVRVATHNGSGTITAILATSSPYVGVGTGARTVRFAINPTTLAAGTEYLLIVSRTDLTAVTPVTIETTSTSASMFFNQSGMIYRGFVLYTAVTPPVIGTVASGTGTTGGFHIGVRFRVQ